MVAVIWAVSCGKRTSRRLQAKAVPAESVHKKTANKVRDLVDSLSGDNLMSPFFLHTKHLSDWALR